MKSFRQIGDVVIPNPRIYLGTRLLDGSIAYTHDEMKQIREWEMGEKNLTRKREALEAVSSILDDLRGLDGYIADRYKRALNLVPAAYSIMDEIYQKLEKEK